MTKKQAFVEFKALCPPGTFTRLYTIGERSTVRIDKIARNEAWGNFIDALCK